MLALLPSQPYRDSVKVSSQSQIDVGLMGLGVVGSGVAEALLTRADAISNMVGCRVVLRRILVKDKTKPRPSSVPQELLTLDPQDILGDPQVRVVIELLGGEKPSRQHIAQALAGGKHVVTANKEVIGKYGPELMAIASKHKTNLLFEASVGGGIPIVAPLMKDLLANDLRSIHAIINGTTNYILTRMARDRIDFESALQEAQLQGFAEADPSNDLEGVDAAHKLAILATLAFHTWVRSEDVYREGITRLEAQDFRYAQKLGYTIKLLAIARKDNGRVQARVHPSFVPQEHLLAKVDWAFNAIEVEGDLIERVVFHGLGAGKKPTTSAVLGDLIEIGKRVSLGVSSGPSADLERGLAIADMSSLTCKYYFRLRVADQAGVLAQIAKVLGELGISLATVLQKDSDPGTQTAEIVIITHPARESAIQESLKLLSGLEGVSAVSNMVRIEEWPSAN